MTFSETGGNSGINVFFTHDVNRGHQMLKHTQNTCIHMANLWFSIVAYRISHHPNKLMARLRLRPLTGSHVFH